MTTRPFCTLTTASYLALAACGGCVLREERMIIARDGSVAVALRIEGGEEELTTGDAMPSRESGWDVVRRIERDDDDEKLVLEASRAFAPGETLPRTFAAEGDPDADLYLDFPTDVRVEERPNGLHFYFRRAYAPRRWAYVKYWEDVFVDDHIKKLAEKPVEALSRLDRIQIVQALTAVEAFKQVGFAKAALAECGFDLPVESWLLARRALLKAYEEDHLLADRGEPKIFEEGVHYVTQVDHLIDRCEPLPKEQRDECYGLEGDRILEQAYAALVQSLRNEAHLTERQITRFADAYERARRYHEITEALGAHHFKIEVTMPGTVVAANSDQVDVDTEAGVSTVTWEFEGDAFRDRPHELLAVSRLAVESDAPTRSPVDGRDR